MNLPLGSIGKLVSVTKGTTGTTFACLLSGWFVSARHVLTDTAGIFHPEVSIRLPAQQTTVAATVMFHSPASDLVLVRVANVPSSIRPLRVRQDTPAPGERLYYLEMFGDRAQPHVVREHRQRTLATIQDGQPTVNGHLRHLAFQANAVVPGCSGSPIVDASGAVVGVLVAKSNGTDATVYAAAAQCILNLLAQPATSLYASSRAHGHSLLTGVNGLVCCQSNVSPA